MYQKGRGLGFGGFTLSSIKKPTPPPPVTQSANNAFSSTTSNTNTPMNLNVGFAMSNAAVSFTLGLPKKRHKNEDEYFEDDDEDQNLDDLEYLPAPGSPTLDQRKSKKQSDESESEEDPLDAFMAGIEAQAIKDKEKAEICAGIKDKKDKKGRRDDIEEEDDQESYFRYMEENPTAGLVNTGDSDIELDYDEDGNPIVPEKCKIIEPLAPIDHSTIKYIEFEKNFYEEHEDIMRLSPPEVDNLRQKLGIKVTGADPPKPCSSFGHFGFDEALIKAIRKSDYTQPTPIQAQAIPIVLNGRDIIGIAKTGSGKTAAYLWPMLIHIMDQRELEPEEGPIGLILAPTRELSQQIYSEAKRFGKVYNINVVCCYGGGSKWEQSKALQEGAEIVVATPGRMIDMIKIKATNLERVTYLVLDEADRMFDMGFEPQVRSICNNVRSDRQTLLFSATFKKKVEKLARDVLIDPIRVVQGDVGEANEDVTQIVDVLPTPNHKWNWLIKRLVEYTSTGSVLIFVTKKLNSEELANNLKQNDFNVGLLHGDMDQVERNKVITDFKRKTLPVLVATDVAARGLDIPSIKTVINYDIARDIDTHTHRIGRTGRAGEKGVAYTLVTDKDKEFVGHLVRNLEGANQYVPKPLMDLAMQSSWFRKSRFKAGRGKKVNLGGRGLGYKERPGFGSSGPTGGGDYSNKFTVESPHAAPAKTLGPQSDRISAMKAAFQAQYKSQFCAASTETAWKTSTAVVIKDGKRTTLPSKRNINNDGKNILNLEGKRNIESKISHNIEGQRGLNMDGQRGFTADGQRMQNFDGQRGVKFDGHRNLNIEGKRGFNTDGKRGLNMDSPRGLNMDSPRGLNMDSPRGHNMDSPRGHMDSPRGHNMDSLRGHNMDSPRSLSMDSPRSLNIDGHRSFNEGPRNLKIDSPRDSQRGHSMDFQRSINIDIQRGLDIDSQRGHITDSERGYILDSHCGPNIDISQIPNIDSSPISFKTPTTISSSSSSHGRIKKSRWDN